MARGGARVFFWGEFFFLCFSVSNVYLDEVQAHLATIVARWSLVRHIPNSFNRQPNSTAAQLPSHHYKPQPLHPSCKHINVQASRPCSVHQDSHLVSDNCSRRDRQALDSRQHLSSFIISTSNHAQFCNPRSGLIAKRPCVATEASRNIGAHR
jgi:ABC-type nickel/cobalt efflux system permease component RcnA